MLVLLFISQVISSLGVIAASYRHVNYRTIAGFCVLRTFWVFEILLVGIIQSNVIWQAQVDPLCNGWANHNPLCKSVYIANNDARCSPMCFISAKYLVWLKCYSSTEMFAACAASVNCLVANGLKFSHPLHHLGRTVNDLPVLAIDSFRHMYVWRHNTQTDIE